MRRRMAGAETTYIRGFGGEIDKFAEQNTARWQLEGLGHPVCVDCEVRSVAQRIVCLYAVP